MQGAPGAANDYKKFHLIILSWHWLILITAFSTSVLVHLAMHQTVMFSENLPICQAFEEGYMPEEEPLRGDDKNLPFAVVADGAFGLRLWMIKPFSVQSE